MQFEPRLKDMPLDKLLFLTELNFKV